MQCADGVGSHPTSDSEKPPPEGTSKRKKSTSPSFSSTPGVEDVAPIAVASARVSPWSSAGGSTGVIGFPPPRFGGSPHPEPSTPTQHAKTSRPVRSSQPTRCAKNEPWGLLAKTATQNEARKSSIPPKQN